MKTFNIVDLGRASSVTASNFVGIAPESDNSDMRIYSL